MLLKENISLVDVEEATLDTLYVVGSQPRWGVGVDLHSTVVMATMNFSVCQQTRRHRG